MAGISARKSRPPRNRQQTLFEFDMQRQAYEEGQEAHQYFVGTAYSPCTVPLSELEPIHISDLQPDGHHRGKVLFIRTIEDGVRAAAVRTIVEDTTGAVERLAVYNVYALAEARDLLSKGTVLAIKEPYLEAGVAGDFYIRIDHPSDLLCLASFDPRIPKEFCSGSEEGEGSALDWKAKGNQFYKEDKYTDAVRAFSFGLERCQPNDSGVRCDMLRNRAITNTYLKRFEDALADAKGAVIPTTDAQQDEKTAALNAKSHFRAGRAAYELRDFDEASQQFKEAAKLAPNDQDTTRELQRAESRLKEQSTGKYDFSQMGKVVNKKKNRLDHADFLTNTKKLDAGSHGNGLFATCDIKAGDLILCEKASSIAFDSDPAGQDFTLLDSESKRQLSGAQALLLFNVVAKLLHNSSAANGFFELFDDDYAHRVPVTKVDQYITVDSFRAQAVLTHNTYGCPTVKTSSKSAQRQAASSTGYRSTGLWLTTSYVNHACNGNTMRSFIGDMMILRATRDIAKREEILMPYRLPHADNSITQEELQKIWGFKCDCGLCQAEARTAPTQRRLRLQTIKEVGDVLSSNPISASKPPARKVMTRLERLMEKLEKTYENKTFESQPRLGLVAPGRWLCQAYADNKLWEDTAKTSVRLLRNLGFIITVSNDSQDTEIDRSKCLLVEDAISAAILGAWASEQLKRPANQKVMEHLAQSLYETLNGEMNGFEDKCNGLKRVPDGKAA